VQARGGRKREYELRGGGVIGLNITGSRLRTGRMFMRGELSMCHAFFLPVRLAACAPAPTAAPVMSCVPLPHGGPALCFSEPMLEHALTGRWEMEKLVQMKVTAAGSTFPLKFTSYSLADGLPFRVRQGWLAGCCAVSSIWCPLRYPSKHLAACLPPPLPCDMQPAHMKALLAALGAREGDMLLLKGLQLNSASTRITGEAAIRRSAGAAAEEEDEEEEEEEADGVRSWSPAAAWAAAEACVPRVLAQRRVCCCVCLRRTSCWRRRMLLLMAVMWRAAALR
jgi:ribosomal protein L12E/L44/L45/RPP1/RPP2